MADSDFTVLPDLACRDLGGSVVFANDELFAEKENLIKAGPPGHATDDFGSKGKVYDGWETRRRREPGSDHAIVRLGCPGVVHGVLVDTAFFRGNYPPEVSVEAVCAEGYPSPAELAGLRWQTLVERTTAKGDTVNSYLVADRHRWTHARLSIYPDGGVARFRVHGEVVPDPDFVTGTVDLAAMENGGQVVDCSDAFYASPSNLIMPGRARVTSDGWENARRRGPGNDYVVFRLGAAGVLRHVEVDTSCFIGNAPGWIRLSGALDQKALGGPGPGHGDAGGGGAAVRAGAMEAGAALGQPADMPASLDWREILPLTAVQPDTRHRFGIDDAAAITHVRLDVLPDGGLARFRVWGEVTPGALDGLRQRCRDTLWRPSA